jgi:hypothetical protein
MIDLVSAMILISLSKALQLFRKKGRGFARRKLKLSVILANPSAKKA